MDDWWQSRIILILWTEDTCFQKGLSKLTTEEMVVESVYVPEKKHTEFHSTMFYFSSGFHGFHSFNRKVAASHEMLQESSSSVWCSCLRVQERCKSNKLDLCSSYHWRLWSHAKCSVRRSCRLVPSVCRLFTQWHYQKLPGRILNKPIASSTFSAISAFGRKPLMHNCPELVGNINKFIKGMFWICCKKL